MTAGSLIAVATALGVGAGPLSLAIAGWVRMRHEPGSVAPFPWRPTFVSTLAFALAFNLTFFIQELFLVLPKALTPGLHPTLFHNNHTWSGSHPQEDLFQGTGALATSISGAACWALLARGRGRTESSRLLLLWMAYAGFFMALPQVVIGAVSEASDLGRAMVYLQLGGGTRIALALAALGVRVPREWIEVVIVPVAVVLAGVPWMQAGAWRAAPPAGIAPPRPAAPLGLVVALAVLLAIFQLVLRRGIPF